MILLDIYKIKKKSLRCQINFGFWLRLKFFESWRPPPMECIRNYCVSLRETRRQWLASFKEREIPVETCSSALSVPVVLPLTSLPSPHRDLATPISSSEIERHFGDDQYRVVRHHRKITLWCFWSLCICSLFSSDAIYSQRAMTYIYCLVLRKTQ